MGWDIAGFKENIMTITRQNFRDYMASLYSADNITVVVAGGIEEKKTLKMIEEFFGKMKSFKTIKPKKIKEAQAKPEVFIKEKKTEQIHIALGVRTVDGDNPKKYPLALLAGILGGGMSSRLFHEVREKRGLAYYVRSSSDHYLDCGSLSTTAGIDPKRVTEAIKVIIDEYAKVAEGKMKISKSELKKAKEYLKGHLVLDLEDSRSVATYYAHQELLEEEILNPDESLRIVDKVSIDEVESVGKEFFVNKGLNLALIGNFPDRQKLEKLLKL